MTKEMLIKEMIVLLKENNKLLQDISGKLDNLVEPTWEPPPPVMSEITEEEQLALNEVQSFADRLKNHPETFTHSLPTGLLVRTDMWAMFDEIKAYTNKQPGEIKSADLPAHLMFGFVHDDGTYWGIRISDMKRSLDKKDNRSELMERAIQTQLGKQNLCAVLSNIKK